MIYLSAQPDETRFIWEVQVQHTNFKNNGIDLKNVYALFGYKGTPSSQLLELKSQLKSNIILVEDTRDNYTYAPTIRPHIISKFLSFYPHLKHEKMFYHDSDICFTYSGLPNWEYMTSSDNWFVSDTRNYLNYDYIVEKGTDILLDICECVGIHPLLVRRNKEHTGGCQYLLYGTNEEFWKQVELTSEKIFRLSDREKIYATQWARCSKSTVDSYHPFQYWVADMMAIQLLAWKNGFDTKIHEDLSFSWACGMNHSYESFKIYHNAGITGDMNKVFFKDAYRNSFPYDIDISSIDSNSNTIFYVKEIIKAGKELGYI